MQHHFQLGEKEKMIKKLVCMPQFFLQIIRLNVSCVTSTFISAVNMIAFFKKKYALETSNFLNLKRERHNIFIAERGFAP